MHSLQVIFEIITPAELFAVATAVIVKALPVAPGDFMDRLFMALSVIRGCKSFSSRARRESAVVDLQVFLLVPPVESSLQ
jgi:hypothetical protein